MRGPKILIYFSKSVFYINSSKKFVRKQLYQYYFLKKIWNLKKMFINKFKKNVLKVKILSFLPQYYGNVDF